jgi:putative membrane protein (TIGR04086 family)
MDKINIYSKKIGFFILMELFIAFCCSLLNLFSLSSSITTIIILITNVIIYAYYGYISGKNGNRKGIIEGLYIGLILIAVLFFINLIFYHTGFNINKTLYYSILILTSMLGGSVGKNKKETN